MRYKNGLPVDSSGELATGEPFADIREFKELLLSDQRRIAKNLLEHLTVYATGAEIGFSDREVIDSILDNSRTDEYGVRTMIQELVQSQVFRHK